MTEDNDNEFTPPPNGTQEPTDSWSDESATDSSESVPGTGSGIREVTKKIKRGLLQTFSKKKLSNVIKEFDPQSSADWANKLMQSSGIAFYGTLGTIALTTYFIADLTALTVSELLPDPPIARMNRLSNFGSKSRNINDYNAIFARNLINSQGLIPGELTPAGTPADPGGAPIKSMLPMALIGTLVMKNEMRSIATIEDKSSQLVYPLRVEDEIPGKIKITQVEARKVIFINKVSNRKEFLELPEELNPLNPLITAGRGGTTGVPGVEKIAANQFNVARNAVDKALSDINNVLTQARAVPNFENGIAAGYKLFQIVPNSIYDQLGLQNGDVISGLNGQPINDPGKAFEMLAELKQSNHLELQVKKDGVLKTYTYDIR